MGKHLIKILLALLLSQNALSQSYGLTFNSHETVPEKRTALDLTPGDSLRFSGPLRINFDMNFIAGNNVYFGYILRVLNGGDNIDFIYDQRAAVFRITEGKAFCGISFSLDSARLYYQWNSISILIDPGAKNLELLVNDKKVGVARISMPGGSFKFLWGANDDGTYQTRDIPSMRLREIRLFDGDNLRYHWALNDISGNTVLDEIHQKAAFIKNPVWIRPAHRNWELTSSFILNGNAVAGFDEKNERLYIAGSDSVLIYDSKNFQNPWTRLAVSHENILRGSQAVYDTTTRKLYNIFIDQKKVAAYSAGARGWDVSFDSALTEYWHPNKFISPLDTSLYIIGGYGQLKYKNIVQRYHLATKEWEIIKPKGDFFPPRYLSALGVNRAGDTAYIMGGYGSPTGDQMLNPTHYYDLFAFDIRSGAFKKIFDLDSAHSKFTFANSLVIDAKNRQFYGLVFPNDSFNSNLRLIRGSLDKPGFQFLGDEIPFSFYDLRSFADLYYSPKAGKLIAVTFYSSKAESNDKTAAIKIYTIGFPPEFITPPVPDTSFPRWSIYMIIVLALMVTLGFGTWIVGKRSLAARQKKTVIPSSLPEAIPLQPVFVPEHEIMAPAANLPAARIYLFGQFQVFDKQGEDITNLFTPVLRELFLLILIYTIRTGRGISAEELTEILWLEKHVKDAKNNRSVNIAKLKAILERLGESLLVRQSGFWQFQPAGDSIYIDYQKYQDLITGDRPMDKGYLKDLLGVLKKGSFLIQTEYGWLDDVKVDISNAVIEICLKFIRDTETGQSHPEYVIELANCIFQFDQLNEYALEYKCRSLITLKRLALAGKTYDKFIKDYRDIYGEDFNKSFQEIINATSANPSPR